MVAGLRQVGTDLDPDVLRARLDALERNIAEFNRAERSAPAALRLSMGVAEFQPGKDSSYREVFARADRAMYEVKKAYYETVGDRRGGKQAPPER